MHIIHLSAEKLQSDIQLQAHVGIQVGLTLLSLCTKGGGRSAVQGEGRGAYSGQLVGLGGGGAYHSSECGETPIRYPATSACWNTGRYKTIGVANKFFPRPKKINDGFPLTGQKFKGSVGRDSFFFFTCM